MGNRQNKIPFQYVSG